MPRQKRNPTLYKGVYFVSLTNGKKSFFIRYKRNGKSLEEKVGRSDEGWDAETANQFRKKRLSEVDSGIMVLRKKSHSKSDSGWIFSKIFERYLRVKPDLKGRENDIYRFKNYLHVDFGDKKPQEVTISDVDRLRRNLENKELKPATVRHVLELLRRLSNFASKKKYCRGLNFKISMPRVENQKTEYLSENQIQKLLEVLDKEPDVQASNLVRLALYTGMRRGELFSLRWRDIDFYKKNIVVRSGKSDDHPKIPLNDMAEKVLNSHEKTKTKSEFVFPGKNGKKRTECKRPLLRIRKKAELPDDFRILQGLRHVYAIRQASRGVNLDSLRDLLTQKSSSMTLRYAHMIKNNQHMSNLEKSVTEQEVSHKIKLNKLFEEKNYKFSPSALSSSVANELDAPEIYEDEELPSSSTSPSDLSALSSPVANELDTPEIYEDEELPSSMTESNVSDPLLTTHNSISKSKSIEISDPKEVFENKFLNDTNHLNSSNGELTENVELFDTFEPEEFTSEQVLDFEDYKVNKEIIDERVDQLDLFDTFEPDDFYKVKSKKESRNIEINESFEHSNNDNLIQTNNENFSRGSDVIKNPEGEEIYDEAVNAVFGLKKESDIDTWAKKEAEAMSARALEGAREDQESNKIETMSMKKSDSDNFKFGESLSNDYERDYEKIKGFSLDEKNEFEKKSNNANQFVVKDSPEFNDEQIKSSEDMKKKGSFNQNQVQENVRPSMKELKKDLQSLSKFINNSTSRFKNNDTGRK